MERVTAAQQSDTLAQGRVGGQADCVCQPAGWACTVQVSRSELESEVTAGQVSGKEPGKQVRESWELEVSQEARGTEERVPDQ